MTLDEAIKHCEEKAKEIRKANEEMPTDCKLSEDLCECANEHEQLAEWLEELVELRKIQQKGEIKMRSIDAEALKEVITANHYLLSARNNSIDYGMFTTGIIQAIDNAPTVVVPENAVNCVLTMFGNCSYNETGCSDCEIKDKIRKALNERPQGEWIPVSERLPEDLEPVNITWRNHKPEPIKGKPFTATGVYFNSQWYWWSTFCIATLVEHSLNYDDIIDRSIEIVAWQPLPEPYKKGEE